MIIKAKFKNIIDLVSNVMEAHTAALFIGDKRAESIELYCSQSFSKKFAENITIRSGEGILGWVFREQKNVVAANFERNSKTIGIYSEDVDIKSMMAVYLPHKMGVLFVDSRRSYAFTEEKEKIFHQMASILFSLLVEQEKTAENWFITRALEANLKTDIKTDTFSEIKELFKEISSCLGLKYLVFFRPKKPVLVCEYDEKGNNYLFKEIVKDKYSPEGLIGWCIKNQKNVLKNRETNSDKTFVINKEDGIKIDNILAIPLQYKEMGNGKNILGVITFSKRKENEKNLIKNRDFWHTRELDILENVGLKLLKKIRKVSDLV